MKKIKQVGVFIGAFVATSVVMTGFEYINYLLFPFPAGLDLNNINSLQEFSMTLPTSTFVMILLGWFFGTMLGVWILQKFLKIENAVLKIRMIYGFAGFLTLLAIFNNYMFVGLGNRLWFEILPIPFFFATTYLTIKYVR